MLHKLNAALIEVLKETHPNRAANAYPLFDLQPQQVAAFLEAVWELWLHVAHDDAFQRKDGLQTSPTAALPTFGRVTLGDRRRDGEVIDLTKEALKSAFSKVSVRGTLGFMLRSSSDCFTDEEVLVAAERALTAMVYDPTGGDGALEPAKVFRHWDHLMYAYLVENTRVVEICRRLLEDLLADEVHGQLSYETFRWLRTTEDLFFRDGNSSLISSVTSWVRPDLGATRRNAYQRMFGIDLNHGTADGRPYPYPKATIANGEFVPLLQELLRELWRGFVNARNTSGTNTTDDTNIRELISRLRSMLLSRRLGGRAHANLAREEFVAVTMMSWFELSVGSGSPVVTDLKAQDSTVEERLRKLGERVKLPMHGKSRNFFTLAQHLPRLLTLIEQGQFESEDAVRLLYTPLPDRKNDLLDAVQQIINHWSLATGVDLKALPTTQGPR